MCLENGNVGQGISKEEAVAKLKEVIESFESICKTDPEVYISPVLIKELHEFLIVEEQAPFEESYELRAMHA